MIDAIVPAYNEARSVADVVRVLRQSPGIGRVLVVDDGSRDRTASQARAGGAEVLSLRPNRGKGQAMLAGVGAVRSDPVLFCDADLVGLRPAHIEQLLALSHQGFDMVCGLREYGLVGNPLQLVGPLITGERVVRRWVLGALPPSCWTGYAIETAMNHTCDRHGARTAVMPMRGVRIRGKVKKTGVLDGLIGHAKMFDEIRRTRHSLRATGACSTAR